LLAPDAVLADAALSLMLADAQRRRGGERDMMMSFICKKQPKAALTAVRGYKILSQNCKQAGSD